MGFFCYSNILLCTYCKYETLLFCKPRTQFLLLLYINKVYWIKKSCVFKETWLFGSTYAE